jgi:hypothetical protein
MSYISVDFAESYRCADLIESLASRLHELVQSDPDDACGTPELCRTLDAYSRKLRELSADLYNATRNYEIEDAQSYGKAIQEVPRHPVAIEAKASIALLAVIAENLDQCAEEVPGEITVRNNLYFRMKDAAKEARILVKEIE